MAQGVNLDCEKRDIKTHGYLNVLRKSGKVPGVIYGRTADSIPVAFNKSDLTKMFYSRGTRGLYTLRIRDENAPVLALIRDVQRNPITGELTHIDFMQVSMKERVKAFVPVVITGEDDVTKTGGIIQTGIKEVEVECLPGDLPSTFQLDISKLAAGGKLMAADLLRPESVDILSEPDALLVVVLHPTKEEEKPAVVEEDKAKGDVA
ncbi:MAG: 50S ribosomal protein L25 [Acidobacteriota bacterium]